MLDLIAMIVMVGNIDFIVKDMWVVMAMLRIARFVMVDVVLEMVVNVQPVISWTSNAKKLGLIQLMQDIMQKKCKRIIRKEKCVMEGDSNSMTTSNHCCCDIAIS